MKHMKDYVNLKLQLQTLPESYAERISKMLNISLEEAMGNILVYRKLFNAKEPKVLAWAAIDLCDTIQKCDVDGDEAYTCFKWHLCGDWLEEQNYKIIIEIASKRFL